MGFADDLKREVARAAREGSEELIMKNARAVKAQMGQAGAGLNFTYVKGSGSSLDNLGTLKVTGPSDDAVEKFHELLRQRMRQ